MEKKIIIGLFLFTTHPKKGFAAALRRRGAESKDGLPIPYPGSFQATVEIECGDSATPKDRNFLLDMGMSSQLGLIEVFHNYDIVQLNHKPNKDEREVVVNYAMYVPWQIMQGIRMPPSDEGIKYVTQDELAVMLPLRGNFTKKEGVPDRGVIALFEDQILALRTGFRKVKPI